MVAAHMSENATPLRVLVACEYSGVVRDAFRALGHDAMSADLLPTEAPGPHYQGDARDLLGEAWDLVVAHPPCTYLAQSGVRWLHSDPDRWSLMLAGAAFFLEFLNAEVPRVACENPVPHRYARELIGRPSQYVEPHEFGTLQTKKTGLWLRGLPPLLAEEDGKAATLALPARDRMPGWWAGGGSGHERSRTFPGVARAMAAQWGGMVGQEAVA
jgi:hypothetical protein